MTARRIEGGIGVYVRVPGGFLPIEPAIRPDSSLRFHRGRAPEPVPVPLYRPAAQGERTNR